MGTVAMRPCLYEFFKGGDRVQLLRPKEVMKKLSISRSKVYQMIRDGELPAIRIGGCVRVPEEALESMLRQQLIEQLSHKMDEGKDGIVVLIKKE
jgi:excisionase family DNA binding protein